MSTNHGFARLCSRNTRSSRLRGFAPQFIRSFIPLVLFLLCINLVVPLPEVAAQGTDPGETDPITPASRRMLFPDQHGLLAMPQNPDSLQPPITYTDWARSTDLQSLELQEAFVPSLQGINQARAAAGHILNQMTEQVAVGSFVDETTFLRAPIQVDILTPSGDLAPIVSPTVQGFSTTAFYTRPVAFPVAAVPNSFDVAVGDLNDLTDEEGIGHDEVALCYFKVGFEEDPPLGIVTLDPIVTVFDYTDVAESGIVQTVTMELNFGFVSEFDWDTLLVRSGSDTIISCDTGDVNGDGVDELILTNIADPDNAWVFILRYDNDGENPPTLEQVGSAFNLKPLSNQTPGLMGDPVMWGSIDATTGDFNSDGRENVAVAIVNQMLVQNQPNTLATYPGIYVLESDGTFNLTQIGRFAEFEAARTSKTDFDSRGGSYACRPGLRMQACETTRASVAAGLFKFHPPTGFNFDRRQLSVVYNMPFNQGGGLRALALEISDDLTVITPLGETITLPQQSCASSFCPSSNRFSTSAGGFVGAGNLDNPQWSLLVSNWEATLDGDAPGDAKGQFHAFWVQAVPLDDNGEGGGLATVWDEVLLDNQDLNGPQTARLPAVAWDREGVSLYLGSPVHIVVEDLVRADYIIAEPPKHIYWWPPDAIEIGDGQILNVSRDDDFFVELKTEEGVTYEHKTEDETDWTIGGSVTSSSKGSVSVGKNLVLARTTATVTQEVQAKVGYDYNENKADYDMNYVEEEKSYTEQTNREDAIISELQLYDIWRYPVSGISLGDDLNAFWEISFPGRTVIDSGGGLAIEWYDPPYENGNILSYPTASGSTFTPPDCCAEFTFLEDGQPETEAEPFLQNRIVRWDGNSRIIELNFSDTSGSGETKSYNNTLSQSLDVSVGFKAEVKLAKTIGFTAEASVSANLNNSNSWSSLSSSFSSTNESTGFILSLAPGNFNQSYSFFPTFYLAEDGTTKVTHAVGSLGQGDTFWTETYGTLPDPALKLPRGFSPVTDTFGSTQWVPNTFSNAKQIRGFTTRFAEPDQAGTFPPIAGAVDDGDVVRLEVEVHNYSVLQGVGNVPILFEAAEFFPGSNSDGPAVPLTCEAGSILSLSLDPLEHKTAICVWDTTGFGPGVPGLQKEYRIVVTLDPDNQITELYEGTVGPGQNNQGFALLSVADPLLTFLLPTSTAAVPDGADVKMDEAGIALVVEGQFETEFARVVVDQAVPLRVCFTSNQAQTGYFHVLIYDGNPLVGGKLMADKLVPGVDVEGTCTWISNLRFLEAGERTLHARVLEPREDGLPGNATDTLRVRVDPITGVSSSFDQGVARGLTSEEPVGNLQLIGTFPYQGDLDLTASTLIVEQVLDETNGAGELIPSVQSLAGQKLTLFAQSRQKGRDTRIGDISQRRASVVFETLEGLEPRVRLILQQKDDSLTAKLTVERAEILQPARCGGLGVTELTTKLLLLDSEHAPVDLAFDKRRWSCKKNRQGEVTALSLPPG